MGWLRRTAARPRQSPSSADPVAAALAEAATGGPLVPRLDHLEPVLDELPTCFSVVDDTSLDEFDTLVSFDDEIHTYCDPAEDGLEAALAEQPVSRRCSPRTVRWSTCPPGSTWTTSRPR